MSISTLFRATFGVCVLAVTLLFSQSAFANCGAVGEGDTDPMNPCQVCKNSGFIPLPVHTRCGNVTCDATGVYEEECVDPNDTGTTSCMKTQRGDSCPMGYACSLTDGKCLQTCDAQTPCQTGYQCDANSQCQPIPEPDMGTPDMGTPDTGAPADVGAGGSDMGTTADTGTDGAGDVGNDIGWSVSDAGFKPIDRGPGCCAVAGGGSDASLIALLGLCALGFVSRRRH